MPLAVNAPMGIVARIKLRFQSSFVRDVAKMSLGTIGGRAIALVVMPLVTRLYSPHDFALLAVYMAIVSTIAVMACLRLEVAIPLAEDDETAATLLAIALSAALVLSLALLIFVTLLPDALPDLLGKPDLRPFVWLVPLGVLLSAAYQGLQYWATRARRFGSIARTRLTQAVSGVAAMLALGWMGIAPLGLLLGNMLNMGAGGLRLAVELISRERALFLRLSWGNMGRVLRSHRRFPIYSMPEALINVAGLQVPVLLIAAHAGAVAGHLFLAMQIMAAPMILLGASISQVYLSRAPDAMREGRLADFTVQIMKSLVRLGVAPLIAVGAIAPLVFPIVFGAEWARSGQIITLLVPWMVLQFIASPVSMVMYVTGRQRAMLLLTVLGAVLRIGGVLLGTFQPGLLVSPVVGFVCGSIAYYGLVWLFVCSAAGFGTMHYGQALRALAWWPIVMVGALAIGLQFWLSQGI